MLDAIGQESGLSPRGRGKLRALEDNGFSVRSIPAWAGETFAFARLTLGCAVYPRVGGGNGDGYAGAGGGEGLSPRGRGKPHSAYAPLREQGSIPAWAGETSRISAILRLCQVYPRVGGGNWGLVADLWRARGLSPRGRGKQALTCIPVGLHRSIPAWAGETSPGVAEVNPLSVYPRVGGGNCSTSSVSVNSRGLSPRGRGKRCPRREQTGCRRSIPAWAGETVVL